MTDDRLYLDLKGALERVHRAQTHGLIEPAHRTALQEAADRISLVGYIYCPSQWSRFDGPEVSVD